MVVPIFSGNFRGSGKTTKYEKALINLLILKKEKTAILLWSFLFKHFLLSEKVRQLSYKCITYYYLI